MLNCPADVQVVIGIGDICVYSAVDNGRPRPGAGEHSGDSSAAGGSILSESSPT